MSLVYIDDVVSELVNALRGKESRSGAYCCVPVEYNTMLGDIVDLLYSFKSSCDKLSVPDMSHIRLRRIDKPDVLEYYVSCEKLEVIELLQIVFHHSKNRNNNVIPVRCV